MTQGVARLFWIDPVSSGSARGLLWPEADDDPQKSELVAFEGEADVWAGDDLVAATHPWVLMSPDLVQAIAMSELTGLRVGAEATLRVPPDVSPERAIGAFRIVVPTANVELKKSGGAPTDGISIGDAIECAG